MIHDALRDLVPFLQFKKREKKIHGELLILVKLQAEAVAEKFLIPLILHKEHEEHRTFNNVTLSANPNQIKQM